MAGVPPPPGLGPLPRHSRMASPPPRPPLPLRRLPPPPPRAGEARAAPPPPSAISLLSCRESRGPSPEARLSRGAAPSRAAPEGQAAGPAGGEIPAGDDEGALPRGPCRVPGDKPLSSWREMLSHDLANLEIGPIGHPCRWQPGQGTAGAGEGARAACPCRHVKREAEGEQGSVCRGRG